MCVWQVHAITFKNVQIYITWSLSASKLHMFLRSLVSALFGRDLILENRKKSREHNLARMEIEEPWTCCCRRETRHVVMLEGPLAIVLQFRSFVPNFSLRRLCMSQWLLALSVWETDSQSKTKWMPKKIMNMLFVKLLTWHTFFSCEDYRLFHCKPAVWSLGCSLIHSSCHHWWFLTSCCGGFLQTLTCSCFCWGVRKSHQGLQKQIMFRRRWWSNNSTWNIYWSWPHTRGFSNLN